MNRFKSTLLALLCLLSLPVAHGQTFAIDNEHSAVLTKVLRFGMVDVVGRFQDVSGTIQYDESLANMSCTLTIDAASYSANNEAGEQAVKSPAFLDAANFPEITFVSNKVEDRDGQLIAIGALTLHGVTNEVEFPISVLAPFRDPTGTETVAVSAVVTINRQDYGIRFDRIMSNGAPLVADEVHIMIDLLAAIQE